LLCWASLCRMSLCWVSWHPFYCYAEYHYAVFLCATKTLVLLASASEKKRKKGFVMLKPGRSRSRGPRPALTVQQTWGSRRPGDNVITHLSLSLTLVWNKLECLTLVSFFRLAYLRVRQKPNRVDHLKGRLLALSANTRLDWKKLVRAKHFCLFGHSQWRSKKVLWHWHLHEHALQRYNYDGGKYSLKKSKWKY